MIIGLNNLVNIHLPLWKRGIEGDLFKKSPLTPLFQRGELMCWCFIYCELPWLAHQTDDRVSRIRHTANRLIAAANET